MAISSTGKLPAYSKAKDEGDRKSDASSNPNSIYYSAQSVEGLGPNNSFENALDPLMSKDEDEDIEPHELKTGLFGSIAVIICVVIGAGIFINPQGTFTELRSSGAALIVYGALGVHTTIGAICFAELGTTFTVSGGDYSYIAEAFGPFLAFQYQFIANLVFVPCVNAILAQTVGKYLIALICVYVATNPQDKFNCGLDPGAEKWTNIGVGAFFTLLVTVTNCFSKKYTEKLDEVFMIGKLLGCVMIITLGVYQLIQISLDDVAYQFGVPLEMKIRLLPSNCSGPGLAAYYSDAAVLPYAPAMSSLNELLNYVHAVYFTSFSYLGWNYLNFLTHELRNPVRDLPRAICISVPLVTALYVCMNIGYMAILDTGQFACTKAMAYDTLNAVAKHEKAVGWIATTFVILAALGGLFGHMMASCRLTIVGAQHHHLPRIFQQVHVTQLSPIPAVLFQGTMTLMYSIIVGFLHPHAVIMSCYCENTFSAIAVLGLIWMRFRRPELKRPLKLWIGVPIFYCSCAFFIFLVPIMDLIISVTEIPASPTSADLKHFLLQLFVVGMPILVFSSGTLVYFFCLSKPCCPRCLAGANDWLERVFHKVLHLRDHEE